jgi:hypothetical protein
MSDIPTAIQDEIDRRGLSDVLDEVTHREEVARSEMLYWKVIRFALQRRVDEVISPFAEFIGGLDE